MDKKPDRIEVYLELDSQKEKVGTLTYTDEVFRFEYAPTYLEFNRAISLGPEMPLSSKPYTSSYLFTPFVERLPPKNNPDYPIYCRAVGITPDETDPLILLSTLGHRGPSSFIFEPEY